MKLARILSIAGSDSGGGAGIQADVRTISRLGGHAMTAITAVTAQNSLGVHAVEIMSADFVVAQIDAVVRDFGVDAIKIGMMGSADIAHAVADYIENLHAVPVIFDPVMVATSGDMLADEDTITAFEKLMKFAVLITPNLPEYDKLLETIPLDQFPCDILLKGGHGKDDILVDRLLRSGEEVNHWQSKRIETVHSHGTGCTLSSAIATYVGQGKNMIDAIGKAREYVRASILAAPKLGAGHGPMGIPAEILYDNYL